MAISTSLIAKGIAGTAAVATTVLGTVLWKSSPVSHQEGDLGNGRNADNSNIEKEKDAQKVNDAENIDNRSRNEEVTKKTKKQLDDTDNSLIAKIGNLKTLSGNGNEIKIKGDGENEEVSLEVEKKDTTSNLFNYKISFSFNENDEDYGDEWICTIKWKNEIEVSDLKKELLGISESNALNTDNMKKTVRICAERRTEIDEDSNKNPTQRTVDMTIDYIFNEENEDDQWFNNFFKNKTPEQQ